MTRTNHTTISRTDRSDLSAVLVQFYTKATHLNRDKRYTRSVEIVRFSGTYAGLSVRDPIRAFPALAACGEVTCLPGLRFDEHDHAGTFEFLYVMRGSCRFQIAGNSTTVNPGEIFIVHPEERHSLDMDDKAKGQILWTRLNLLKLPGQGTKLQALLLQDRTRILLGAHDVEPVIRGIIRQAMRRGPRYARVISAQVRLMVELLLQCVEARELPARTPARRRSENDPVIEVFAGPNRKGTLSWEIDKAIEAIRKQLDGRLKIDNLAAVAGYSVSHFYYRFQAETGTTPHQFHLNLRLEAAKEALLRPESTVLMVAELFGFSSGQHFSTVFTKAVGLTPSAWRAEYRQKA